eukprot:gnl/Dysnectes_brevis/1669_a1899_2125.p1 GENE.gnl/Dysnectes_brevis/1669_a1899_2125~~gnl/Dysnectes_brevis/1669_a1899_2125.p1  ORF type:complete len:297 (+),score=108.37 gnl/Dysnectes_brevis/1669_a1899_2125:140-1030(+)
MSSPELKAAQFYQAGIQKLKKRGPFGMFGSDVDGAIMSFEKAGNYFKMAKNWSRAGDSYERVSNLHIKMDKPNLATTPLQSAISCYNKCDPDKATTLVRTLAELSMQAGRFFQAGRVIRGMAESAEEEGRWKQAHELYKEAMDIFSGESSAESEGRNCKLKRAEIGAQRFGEYLEAAQLFEEVGTECVKIKLLQFHARGYLLRSWLCLVSGGDQVAAQDAVDKFRLVDPSLADSPEEEFMDNGGEAIAEGDPDAFAECVGQFMRRRGRQGDLFMRFILGKSAEILANEGDGSDDIL